MTGNSCKTMPSRPCRREQQARKPQHATPHHTMAMAQHTTKHSTARFSIHTVPFTQTTHPVDAGLSIALVCEHPAVGSWWRQVVVCVPVPLAVAVCCCAGGFLAALLPGLVVVPGPAGRHPGRFGVRSMTVQGVCTVMVATACLIQGLDGMANLVKPPCNQIARTSPRGPTHVLPAVLNNQLWPWRRRRLMVS
jgi:hypothetical protein